MMNQQEVRRNLDLANRLLDTEAELADIKEKIQALQAYLNGDKFSKDPTVQVVDVLTRLGLR